MYRTRVSLLSTAHSSWHAGLQMSVGESPCDRNTVFAIGTGRCGTDFLAKVLAREPAVASSHERNALNETFHRYCQWYGLPVDHEGFLRAKAGEIAEDLRSRQFSFEASAHLSLSVLPLFERFGAKFILLVRRPDRVINSYLAKGWYEQSFVCADPALALGYQPVDSFHRFLGRIAPRGEEFHAWNRLTRVGKLSWYWSELNRAVLRQFADLPATHYRIIKIEEFDHAAYRDLAAFMGFAPSLSAAAFARLRARRPNRLGPTRTVGDWTAQEVEEFETFVGPSAGQFGYEHRVERLLADDEADRRQNFWMSLVRRLTGTGVAVCPEPPSQTR
jgi:hypothetical protein